jgi:hypothetical protein
VKVVQVITEQTGAKRTHLEIYDVPINNKVLLACENMQVQAVVRSLCRLTPSQLCVRPTNTNESSFALVMRALRDLSSEMHAMHERKKRKKKT